MAADPYAGPTEDDLVIIERDLALALHETDLAELVHALWKHAVCAAQLSGADDFGAASHSARIRCVLALRALYGGSAVSV